jgi:uncharacterized membrane protein YtjA (UPF0391 family)
VRKLIAFSHAECTSLEVLILSEKIDYSLSTKALCPGLAEWHALSRMIDELKPKGIHMLSYAITFLIIAIIAGVLGFVGIAGLAAEIARILFFVFLVLFIVSLVAGRRPPV